MLWIWLLLLVWASAGHSDWVVTFKVDSEDNEVVVRWGQGLDPHSTCQLAVKKVPDSLMRFTLCSVVSRLVMREHEEVVLSATLPNGNVMALHQGDDPGLIMYAARQLYGCTGGEVEAVAAAFLDRVPLHVLHSPQWMETRARNILPAVSYHFSSPQSIYHGITLRYTPYSSPQASRSPSSTAPFAITLGITTCRRLAHFLRTMRALMDLLGPLPNAFISRVIVVDDGSSEEDRAAMRAAFPSLQYVFKGISPYIGGMYDKKGHAASMNILSHLTSSRYLLYLEDDWEAHSTPMVTSALAPYLDPAWAPQAQGVRDTSAMQRTIEAALAILQHSGVEAGGQVHQVLFNDQHHRVCALGDGQGCPTERVGRGGWPRRIVTPTATHGDGPQHPYVGLPYSLHEYGIVHTDPHIGIREQGVGLSGAVDGSRNAEIVEPDLSSLSTYATAFDHDFSTWTGLSLNPGLWDLRALKELLGGLVSRGVPTSDLFDVHDETFEKSWSMASYAAGARMAYLHGLFFRHIGDVSAYELNGLRRAWDRSEDDGDAEES